MKGLQYFLLALILSCSTASEPEAGQTPELVAVVGEDPRFLSYECDPAEQDLRMFWKNDSGEIIKTFSKLKEELAKEDKKLLFAMNGGMFMENFAPLGLYVEKGEKLSRMNRTQTAHGNFYLQPNGVFYVGKGKRAGVCPTDYYDYLQYIDYATQSGPMLLINGRYHPALTEGSKNLHIRNGVGILPDGKVLFVMSKERVNFYDLATFFKEKGCSNALYLDGFVSRTYLPEKNWDTTDGRFGVIIAVTE